MPHINYTKASAICFLFLSPKFWKSVCMKSRPWYHFTQPTTEILRRLLHIYKRNSPSFAGLALISHFNRLQYMFVLMLSATRMQPKSHMLVVWLAYIHLAGAHGFLRNMFSKCVLTLIVCIICDRHFGPMFPSTLPCQGHTSSHLKWGSVTLWKHQPPLDKGNWSYFSRDTRSRH